MAPKGRGPVGVQSCRGLTAGERSDHSTFFARSLWRRPWCAFQRCVPSAGMSG
jgi:hypothetical protein